MARAALTWCVPNVHPAEWAFEPQAHGRPEVVGPPTAPPLRFNISHTDGLVGLIVTTGADCGVDIETIIAPRSDLEGLSRTVLANSEFDALARLPPLKRLERFTALWTLKEAYAKARGLGLSLPFDRIAFDLDAPAGIRLTVDPALHDDGDNWLLKQWKPSPRHIAALAVLVDRSLRTCVTHHSGSPPVNATDRRAPTLDVRGG
jgi:4'-phosphopantetheinyl transferase